MLGNGYQVQSLPLVSILSVDGVQLLALLDNDALRVYVRLHSSGVLLIFSDLTLSLRLELSCSMIVIVVVHLFLRGRPLLDIGVVMMVIGLFDHCLDLARVELAHGIALFLIFDLLSLIYRIFARSG